MKNLYRTLANQMYSVLSMSVSVSAQDKMLEIVFKDSPFILQEGSSLKEIVHQPTGVNLFDDVDLFSTEVDPPETVPWTTYVTEVTAWNTQRNRLLEDNEILISKNKHLTKTLSGVNTALGEKNKDFSDLVDANDVLKEENRILQELLDEATGDKELNPTPDQIEDAKKLASSPTYIKGLPDDENPFLPRRNPYTRNKGCALRKHEVWQIRRYINSGRSYQFIEKTMNVGPSTISSIKNNKSYQSIPMEQRDAAPIVVHAGYGVVGQKRKQKNGKKG